MRTMTHVPVRRATVAPPAQEEPGRRTGSSKMSRRAVQSDYTPALRRTLPASSLLTQENTVPRPPNFKQEKKRREEMQKKRNEEKQRQQAARKGNPSPEQKP